MERERKLKRAKERGKNEGRLGEQATLCGVSTRRETTLQTIRRGFKWLFMSEVAVAKLLETRTSSLFNLDTYW